MPEAFRDRTFVGNYGSWNRNAFNGYKIIFMPFANGRPSVAAQDVVTGFLVGHEARGQPVGLAMDGTGGLLIADDAGNTVWRVAATDGSITARPLSTYRVSASIANDATSMRPLEEKPGDAATGDRSATPAQTDIAPAVSPEDGQ